MIGIDKVNMQELKAAVKELNGLELLASTIKVIGVTKQVLVDSFVAGVESISDEDSASLTDGVVNMYNSLFADEVEGGDAAKDDEPAEKAAAEKPAKEKKEKKPKKAVEKGPFGSTVGSGANNIDVALAAGGTIEELMAASGCTKSRINVHMKFLVNNRNVVIDKTEGDTPKFTGALKA